MKKLILLKFLLLFFTTISFSRNNLIYISGKVKDKATNAPIVGAKISLFQRPFEMVGIENIILSKLENAVPLNIIAYTNNAGEYNLTLTNSNTSIFALCVEYYEYETLIEQFIFLNENTNSKSIDFSIYKGLNSADMAYISKLDSIYEEEKQQLEIEKLNNPDSNLPFTNELPTNNRGCSYSVPQTVPVKNLYNGYNNPSCNNSSPISGFSGIVYIDFDDYIAGVVTGELGGSFPTESKKAQAVAARSYSLYKVNNSSYANCGQAFSTTTCASCTTAATSTSGQVMLYNGSVINASYSARCNGNYTQNANQGVWTASSNCNLSGNYTAYLLSRPCSGHVSCNSVSGESPCCNVTISTVGTSGYIYGHGVGMCQRGAQGFANNGQTYDQILNNFYSNICITSVSQTQAPSNDNCSSATTLQFGSSCNNVSGTMVGATESSVTDLDCSSPSFVGNNDVWYKVALPAGVQNVTFKVSNMVQTGGAANFDLIMGVYASCSTNSYIFCDDNNGQPNGPPEETYNMSQYAGQTVYIRIQEAGTALDYGTFDICVYGTVAQADLTVTNNNVTPTTVLAGDNVTASATTNNIGGASSNTASELGYYLSTNCTYDANDILLDTDGLSTIGAGNSENDNQSLTIPANTPSGTYYIVFYTDNNGQTTESNENNNTTCTQITVNQPVNCNYNISPPSATVSAAAGSITFNLTTDNTCDWTNLVSSNCQWLSFQAPDFIGSQTVTVDYQANTLQTSRVCVITVGNQTYTLTQQAPGNQPCIYTLASSSDIIPASQTTYSLGINASAQNCTWTATENCPWLTILNPNGTGSGTINFSFPVNTSQTNNVCTINVGGETFTLTQQGVSSQPGDPPVADFYADQTSYVGECPATINFFDNSINNPTAWQWEFFGSGVNPANSSQQNPIVTYSQPGTFTVKLTAINNDGTDSQVNSGYITIDCITTSIKENSIANLNLYPNPTQGIINLTLDVLKQETLIVEVYNTVGQMVYSQNIGKANGTVTKQINLGQSSAGLYLMRLAIGNSIVTRTFIVE